MKDAAAMIAHPISVSVPSDLRHVSIIANRKMQPEPASAAIATIAIIRIMDLVTDRLLAALTGIAGAVGKFTAPLEDASRFHR